MGHVRLGVLPRTRAWKEVVGLIAAGADVSQIANATITAAEKAFSFVMKDVGYTEAVWLMTQMAIAAKKPDIHQHLAAAGTGLRWHVRAFDRKSGEFRDFVVTRIEQPTVLNEEPLSHERPDNDIQWTRIVELDLVPHPRLGRPEIIRMDYGMADGSLRMRVRAAVAGYMLLRWSVDASPDHSLKEEQYRLWLSDPLALYGVENAKLAPGYQAPAAKTIRK